ncbi:MAG: glycosyltransferase [Eubacteriales bacterium]|nr:glycosyltransferase [Eubacteriales bacterium]
MRTVDVIIPTFKPDKKFQMLVERLCRQTVLPAKILIMNTEQEWWEKASFDKTDLERMTDECGIYFEVHHIRQEEFDHGGTRAAAAAMSRADTLLFMTQDAMPADRYLVENLLGAFEKEENVAAVYARQLPEKDCGILEKYTREFNYGKDSLIKSAEDLPRLGIKTYFCSNVCAAYDRAVYEKLGGFIKKAIFNEDMVFAAELIRNGYKVAYEADAKVIHSHNYSGIQQFHRNFDMAVSQAQNAEIFADIPSEGEGLRLVKGTAVWLCKNGKFYLIPKLIWQSGCKYTGYLMGKNYRKLPQNLILKCSMNKKFWKNKKF